MRWNHSATRLTRRNYLPVQFASSPVKRFVLTVSTGMTDIADWMEKEQVRMDIVDVSQYDIIKKHRLPYNERYSE